VRCFKTDRGVLSPVLVPRSYEGPRATAHGGIVATYLDEILAGAAFRAIARPPRFLATARGRYFPE